MAFGDNLVVPGQFNGSGNANANLEDIFTLEVEAQFQNENIADMLQTTRTISHGRSAVFDIYANMGKPERHVPGAMIDPKTMKFGQRTIHIDGLCLQSVQIPEIDEMKNHYDIRQPATEKIAYSLAEQYHSDFFAVALNGARMTAADLTANGFPDGIPSNSAVSGAGAFGTTTFDGDFWINACFEARRRWNEINVPKNDRYLVVRPEDYSILASDPTILNADFGSQGSGLSEGRVLKLAGITILESNWLPSTNITRASSAAATGAGPQNFKSVGGSVVDTYGGDFSNTRGLFLQKRGVATVKLMGISTEIGWERLYQSHVAISKYAVGHGVLRPECLIEVRDTTP